MNTKKITTLGILTGMAILVNILIHFPIIPAVSFLNYDPKDVIIVISGFIYGPMTSLIMSVLCSIIEIFYRSGTVIDVIMNILSTCSFAVVAAYIYTKNRSKRNAVLGLIAGVIVNVAVMTVWNYIITPIYFAMPREDILPLMLPGIIPFNLIKSSLNAGITLFLYKPLVTILRQTNLVEKRSETKHKYLGFILLGGFIVISCVLLILVFQHSI